PGPRLRAGRRRRRPGNPARCGPCPVPHGPKPGQYPPRSPPRRDWSPLRALVVVPGRGSLLGSEFDSTPRLRHFPGQTRRPAKSVHMVEMGFLVSLGSSGPRSPKVMWLVVGVRLVVEQEPMALAGWV